MPSVETHEFSKQDYIPPYCWLRNPNQEKAGSKAFSLEYLSLLTDGELRRNIISYLGEYRFQVPKYAYELIFGHDKYGQDQITLRDKERAQPLRKIAQRALKERRLNGDPIHREEAEEKGLKLLEDKLKLAKTGDTIIWASPPGPKEQGYGEYGFIYIGKVTRLAGGEAHLGMSAIRLEKPTLNQYNNCLNAFTNENINNSTAEEFLGSPKIVPDDFSSQAIDSVLKTHFSFTPDLMKQAKFALIIEQMKSMIDDFIFLCRLGLKSDKLKAFYALENYALKLKNESAIKCPNIILSSTPRLGHIIDKYGFMPPVVSGSCGSTGAGLISIGGGEIINMVYGSDKFGSRSFKCPACKQNNIRPTNELLNKCQHCGSSEISC